MAENPLLPDDELRSLLALTRRIALAAAARARKAQKTATRSKTETLATSPGTEALLAATLQQIEPGDLCLSFPQNPLVSQFAPGAADLQVPELPDALEGSRLLAAASMAQALKSAATNRLVLVYLSSGFSDASWQSALAWAQDRMLPLVLVASAAGDYEAARNTKSPRAAFTWNTVQRACTESKLPILTTDGEDPVALYRVMQESVLRARSGGGPALIWAALPSQSELTAMPPSARPVRRLERYLRTRSIPF